MGIGMKLLGDIFPNNKIITIAEIGLNHNGNLDSALDMIEQAARAGADAVKLQTFIPELLYSQFTDALLTEGIETKENSTQIDFFKKFIFNAEEIKRIKAKADSCNVEFFSSPFDTESVDVLERLQVRVYKIASSEVTNHQLLKRIASTGKPVLMSTGMADIKDISEAYAILEHGCSDIILMHCVSLYPTPLEEVNLLRMRALQETFQCVVGFSDHTQGIKAAIAAGYMGAKVIEKHFMLHHEYVCPDAAVSVTPEKLSALIHNLKECNMLLGNGEILYGENEAVIARAARKSLFSRRDIPEGKTIEEDDTIAKRPGVGMTGSDLCLILGKKSKCHIPRDYLLKKEYFI
jgi:N,N'-diacetyllegionaminate synthase